ncbi:fungal-specific transcription factor domain-containing protein [Powellomyces hirtus]|nr:fungal-specific transcription factor domain-containing protein [Powellomyces hirtus]
MDGKDPDRNPSHQLSFQYNPYHSTSAANNHPPREGRGGPVIVDDHEDRRVLHGPPTSNARQHINPAFVDYIPMHHQYAPLLAPPPTPWPQQAHPHQFHQFPQPQYVPPIADPPHQQPHQQVSRSRKPPANQVSTKPPRKRKRGNGRHVCDYPGCLKEFTRADHLARHQLNHTQATVHACKQCDRTFVRTDLLLRHSQRHLAKDQASEKSPRSVRYQPSEPSPTILANHVDMQQTPLDSLRDSPIPLPASHLYPPPRPLTQPPLSASSHHHPLSHRRAHSKVTSIPPPLHITTFVTNRPPSSASSSEANMYTHNLSQMGIESPSLHASSIPSALMSVDARYGGPTVTGNMGRLPSDSVFSMCSSFSALLSASLSDSEDASPQQLGRHSIEHYSQIAPNLVPALPQTGLSLLSAASSLSKNQVTSSPQTHPFVSPAFDFPAGTIARNYDWLLDGNSVLNSQYDLRHWASSTFDGTSVRFDLTMTMPSDPATPVVGHRHPPAEISYDVFLETVPQQLQGVIDDVTHGKVIDILRASAFWQTISLRHMQLYVDLYWNCFHKHYPILHRPTFNSNETPSPVILSVILIGTFYSKDSSAFDFAVASNDRLRAVMLDSDSFGAQKPPWVLQTMILTEMFGKMMSTRPQHDMAHIFHGSLITMARRSCIFTPATMMQTLASQRESLEARWRAWIRTEQLKRLGLFAFMCDTLHAAIFGQTALMSAFELHLSLPANEEIWEAPTAEQWVSQCKGKVALGDILDVDSLHTPKFLDILKWSFFPRGILPSLNPFSKLVVLHGLLNVCWDVQWRNQAVAGFIESNAPDPASVRIKELLPRALDTWMARLESRSQYDPTSAMHLTVWSSASLHYVAFLALTTDLTDLQIYAVMKSNMGHRIQGADRERAAVNMQSWAATNPKGGRVATWHAVKFLRACILKAMPAISPALSSMADTRVSNMVSDSMLAGNDALISAPNAPHHARCVYLALLTKWAYTHAVGRAVNRAHHHQQPHHLPGNDSTAGAWRWDEAVSYCDLILATRLDDLPRVLDRELTIGLLRAFAQGLEESRWEISRESAAILYRLPM